MALTSPACRGNNSMCPREAPEWAQSEVEQVPTTYPHFVASNYTQVSETTFTGTVGHPVKAPMPSAASSNWGRFWVAVLNSCKKGRGSSPPKAKPASFVVAGCPEPSICRHAPGFCHCPAQQ